ncbi:MAG: MlaD family protein [Alphaproteobacteria bacterium]|jgi:phospholipid/cholesterol/gamma-HCH transport system substrate-binding protein
METKANTTLIGAFSLAVLVTFFGFLYWFLRAGDNGRRAEYRVVFTGPVSGLRTGANVFFNGIRVGDVRTVRVDPVDPRQVVALISIDPSTPVRRNTKVALDVTLLAGTASVAMTGGPAGSEEITPIEPGQPAELRAEGSSVQDLLQGARAVMVNVDNLVRRLDETVEKGRGPIERSLANVEKFTAALGENSDQINDFLKATGEAARNITGLVRRLESVTGQLEVAMQGVEPGRVASILRNVDTLTQGLSGQTQSFADLLRDARGAASAVERTLASFDMAALNRTLAGADRVVSALNAERINKVLADVDRFTSALGNNSDSVETVMKGAADITTKLNAMADRVDSLLKSFEGNGSSNMFAEFTATARSIRTLAERLDTRTATLTNSISGFTDRTIRDIQSLSADGRRTLSELDRTLRSLERNPQRFIFGGSGVPEYNRR